MLALGYAEEVVWELVLRHGVRRVGRAYGQHGGRSFSLLRASKLADVYGSACHGFLIPGDWCADVS